MTRTKATLGSLILCALATWAIGSSSASALTAHECLQAAGTAAEYSSSTCETIGGAGYHTVAITGEPEVEGTLTPTTAGMNVTVGEPSGEHAVLHFVAGGISVQITCSAMSTPLGKLKNVAGPAVTGSGKAKFTGCSIVNSAKAKENCEVPTELETEPLSVTTEEDKAVFRAANGVKIMAIAITSIPGKKCPEAVTVFNEVIGVARGVAATPTSLEFSGTSGSELEIRGPASIVAQFTAVTHGKTKNSPQNLIALETP